MYYVVYWRFKARCKDLRAFKDMEELMDWLQRAQKFDTIAIIGIYNNDTQFGETEKAIEDFEKCIGR